MQAIGPFFLNFYVPVPYHSTGVQVSSSRYEPTPHDHGTSRKDIPPRQTRRTQRPGLGNVYSCGPSPSNDSSMSNGPLGPDSSTNPQQRSLEQAPTMLLRCTTLARCKSVYLASFHLWEQVQAVECQSQCWERQWWTDRFHWKPSNDGLLLNWNVTKRFWKKWIMLVTPLPLLAKVFTSVITDCLVWRTNSIAKQKSMGRHSKWWSFLICCQTVRCFKSEWQNFQLKSWCIRSI